jgi:ABC-type Fe3+ transport system substrate-binding protein
MIRRAILVVLFAVLSLLLFGCSKTVTLYTDGGKDNITALLAPFTKSTNIAVNIVNYDDVHRLADSIAAYSGSKYVKTEYNMASNYADAVFSTDMTMGTVLKERDMLQQYTPTTAGETPAGAKLDGWWYGMGGRAWVIAWNTDLVLGSAPSALLDLAAKSFPSGAISAINPNYILYYPCGACAILGKDKIVPFLQTLIDKKTDWEAKPAQTAKAVADGKAWACITTLEEADKLKKNGSHIDWALPDQKADQMGAYVQYNVVCLIKDSRNLRQAKQLVDYLMSPEAEALSVSLGLSNVTLRSCGSAAPVAKPLATNLAAAQSAMQNSLPNMLVYFTSVNPDYKGK